MLTSNQLSALLDRERHFGNSLAAKGEIPHQISEKGVTVFDEHDVMDYILKTFVPNVEPNWGAWFSGLVDGEGHFAIEVSNGGTTFTPRFSIGLRIEEEEVIREIHSKLGCGGVYITPKPYTNKYGQLIARKVEYYVSSLSDCRKLDTLFRVYPLRTNKRQDFEIWSELISLKLIPKSKRTQELKDRLRFLFQEIRRVRLDRKLP